MYFFYYKESKKSAHGPRKFIFLGSKNLCRFFTVPPPRIYTVEKKHKNLLPKKSFILFNLYEAASGASREVEIKKSKFDAATQNMVVTVTDPQLLDATGGIVQGLSGSPILQNGKLVGAVTHVLIDDPTKGYGIFAENMLKNAKKAEKRLKKAS